MYILSCKFALSSFFINISLRSAGNKTMIIFLMTIKFIGYRALREAAEVQTRTSCLSISRCHPGATSSTLGHTYRRRDWKWEEYTDTTVYIGGEEAVKFELF